MTAFLSTLAIALRQTRVLRELLGDEREDGRIVGALEMRDDGLLRRLLETLRRLDDDEALLAHERHRIVSRRELVGGERPTFEHVLVEVEIAELCHALVETPVDELRLSSSAPTMRYTGRKSLSAMASFPQARRPGASRPSVFLAARTGFEPVISALRGRRPKPLDERAMSTRRWLGWKESNPH